MQYYIEIEIGDFAKETPEGAIPNKTSVANLISIKSEDFIDSCVTGFVVECNNILGLNVFVYAYPPKLYSQRVLSKENEKEYYYSKLEQWMDWVRYKKEHIKGYVIPKLYEELKDDK